MYEGKPLVLVIGGSDTGRAPITAALLRRALNGDAIVQSAGVVAHEGESAAPEAQMALEQAGIDLSHVARGLRAEVQRDAELLLAVDRGTELVLHTELPHDPRVTGLSALAQRPDVLDPHRMPLGVWVAVMRQLDEQIRAALPALRQRLGLASSQNRAADPAPLPPIAPLITPDTKVHWARDEAMQRLLGLINEQPANEALPAALPDEPPPSQPGPIGDDEAAPLEQPRADVATSENARAAHVERSVLLIAAAAELPEVVDWNRLREALRVQLRALAARAEDAHDFTPAATLMIEGKLAQIAELPSAQAFGLLKSTVERFRRPIAGSDLGAIGSELALW